MWFQTKAACDIWYDHSARYFGCCYAGSLSIVVFAEHDTISLFLDVPFMVSISLDSLFLGPCGVNKCLWCVNKD